jgi:hypothetical protein
MKRPSCVALPLPAIETDKNGGVPGVIVAVPSNPPLNGTSWSLEKTPAPFAFALDEVMDRLADDRDVGLVGAMGWLQPTNSAIPTTPTKVRETCIGGSV